MKRCLTCSEKLHLAIIMDGNGRWATRRKRPRRFGHRAGVEAARNIIAAAPSLGVGTLTLFAFSALNWRRPPKEIAALMGLFKHYLQAETDALASSGVRLSVIGRRDRLPSGLPKAIAAAEHLTRGGDKLHLRLAIDYSGREAIRQAMDLAALSGMVAPITDETAGRWIAGEAAPDVDLLIRTSGEQRLSDFLLWEAAHAEFYVTETLWPDFTATALAAALDAFTQRERRFGATSGGGVKPHAAAL